MASIPLSEADQIVAGRLFMAFCEIVSVACVYRIAREFTGSREAALASFAYLASGYVLAHGISFRADPLAGTLMMAALAVLISGPPRRWASVLSGILVALGLLVTIKSVFLFPAFAGALFWRWAKSGFEPRFRTLRLRDWPLQSPVRLSSCFTLKAWPRPPWIRHP